MRIAGKIPIHLGGNYPTPSLPKNPRFCPACLLEDQNKCGFTIFWREHQLPAVKVCWKHGEILCHGCRFCGLYPIRNMPLAVAGRCNCKAGIEPMPVCDIAPPDLGMLQWIAAQSAAMVDSFGCKCVNVREFLHSSLIAGGLSRGRTIDYRKLSTAIEKVFSPELQELLGVSVWHGERPSPWVRRLLNADMEDRKTPAIYFLLTIGALFDSLETFEQAYENIRCLPCLDEASPCSRLYNLKPAQPPTWGANLGTALQAAEYSLYRVAREIGVSMEKLATEIIRQKIRVQLSVSTQKKLGKRSLKAIRADLRAGVPKTKIQRRYKCSAWAIILVELDEPGLRELFHLKQRKATQQRNREKLLAYLATNPLASRCAIQESLPGVYDFMINEDREWFRDCVARKTRSPRKAPCSCRVDYAALDSRVASKVDKIFDSLLDESRKPVWATKSAALKDSGVYRTYRQFPDRFPKTVAVLSQRVENRDDFIKRRIAWAVKRIGEDFGMVAMNNLRQISDLRVEDILRHKEFVQSFSRELRIAIDPRSTFFE